MKGLFGLFKRKPTRSCECGHFRCFHVEGVYRCMEPDAQGNQCRCIHFVEAETTKAEMDVEALERMTRQPGAAPAGGRTFWAMITGRDEYGICISLKYHEEQMRELRTQLAQAQLRADEAEATVKQLRALAGQNSK